MAITFMDRLISDLKNLAKSVTDHINDLTAKLHITSSERANWNAAKSSIDEHVDETDIHLTAKEKTNVGYLSGTTSNIQEQLNNKAPSSHVGDSTHITSSERANWNAKPRIWSTTKTLSGDLNGQVLTITHTLGVAPKMVFAYISTGGTAELNAGTTASPLTLFVFATVPLVNDTASTTQIDVLIPDVATSSSTVLTISALY